MGSLNFIYNLLYIYPVKNTNSTISPRYIKYKPILRPDSPFTGQTARKSIACRMTHTLYPLQLQGGQPSS